VASLLAAAHASGTNCWESAHAILVDLVMLPSVIIDERGVGVQKPRSIS
jgi:hypothetical protein